MQPTPESLPDAQPRYEMTRIMSATTLLRAAIVVLAALELFHFSDGIPLAFEVLTGGGARWFDALSAFAVSIAAPLCALAAAGLAIASTRLLLAGVLLGAALLFYWAHVIAFAIGISLYGF